MDIRKYKERNNSNVNNLIKKILPIVLDYNDVYKKLNKEERKVLSFYKGSGFEIVNKLLLENYLISNFETHEILEKILNHNKLLDIKTILEYYYTDINKKIKLFDEIIGKYELKDEITVFRGMSDCTVFKNMKIGNTFKFKNFVSTSLDLKVALQFSRDCILELKLPPGTNVSYLNWDVDHMENLLNQDIRGSEFEILLGRNYIFKLTKISSIKNKYRKMTWKNIKDRKTSGETTTVYHLTFIKQDEKKDLQPFREFSSNVRNFDIAGFTDVVGLDNIYYKRKNRMNNRSNKNIRKIDKQKNNN